MMPPFLLAAALVLQPAPGSKMTLEVYKTGLMSGKKHVFEFTRFQGTLAYDAAQPEASRVELAINAASIECKDTWLSESDRKKVMDLTLGAEMLDVRRHPTIRFSSTAITNLGGNRYQAAGLLTIRGVSKPVSIDLTATETGGKLQLSGKATIRLKDYNLKPPSAVLGAIGTRNEMLFEFTLLAENL
jgi:polyisoprenoid-binding protein YceI